MKKWIMFCAALVSIGFVGCQKENGVDDAATALDATAVEQIVASTAARYAISADSSATHFCKGKWTEVAVTDLSSTITTYISTNYSGSTITYAAADSEGKTVVSVTLADGSVVGLLFNADGSFKAELKKHKAKAKLTKVEVAALPASITSYVTSTYPTGTLKAAGTNSDGEYLVAVTVDGGLKVLLFDANGTFVKELEKPAHKKERKGQK